VSRKANPTFIGAFVVGAVALAVAGVVIFGSGKFFTETKKFVMFFNGSVKGLNIGAPLAFKGVKVGSVKEIKLFFDERDLTLKIPVYVEMEPKRISLMHGGGDMQSRLKEKGVTTIIEYLLHEGLRAKLGMQSLVTGQLYVDLDFYPDKPLRLVGAEPGVPEVPTIASGLEELSKTVEKIPLEDLAQKLLAAIEGIEQFVNSPELKETVVHLNATVKDANTLVRQVADQVKPLASRLDKTLAEAQKLFSNADSQIKPLASGIGEAVKDTRKLVQNLDSRVGPLASGLENSLKATEVAVKQAAKTLASLEAAAGENSPLQYELAETLKELGAAARSLRDMTDYLERHPEALLHGKGR
jgi:paraquat-inducible protein B